MTLSQPFKRKLNPSIKMSEMRVDQGEAELTTLLGSCVGLSIYDERRQLGGVAHILLPESQSPTATPGKFADTAVPELLRLLKEQGGDPKRFVAKIAGGANMLASKAETTIGDQNVIVIRNVLEKHGIPLVGECCGGIKGRKMTLYTADGRVTIEVVGGESTTI